MAFPLRPMITPVKVFPYNIYPFFFFFKQFPFFVNQGGLKLRKIFLFLPLECWDQRCSVMVNLNCQFDWLRTQLKNSLRRSIGYFHEGQLRKKAHPGWAGPPRMVHLQGSSTKGVNCLISFVWSKPLSLPLACSCLSLPMQTEDQGCPGVTQEVSTT